jgi:2,6-dihydroxypyridine 3-monooxygenase
MATSANDNCAKYSDSGRYGRGSTFHIHADRSPRRESPMMRAVVVGGSLGGLTTALLLREQGWDVDILERSSNPLEGRGTGIVLHPKTIRYLAERTGNRVGGIGLPARRVQYLETDGSILNEQPCALRFASYVELYRGLLDLFGTERYHLSKELAHLDDRVDSTTVSLTDGQTLAADLVVCADGVRSTGRRLLVPDAQPRYAGYVAWRGTVAGGEISRASASVLLDAFTYRILPDGHLLTYAIPGPRGSVLFNWLWYQNIAPGDPLADLLTDRDGVRAELTVPPGSVAARHVEKLYAAATDLPSPLAEVIHQTAKPFIQVIVDLEVPQMAFGRCCLVGDAAFALRPHIGVGTAKAADDAWQLATALLGVTAQSVPDRLKSWETQQLSVGRRALRRARVAGRSLQDGTWRVGEQPPFGLLVPGDSVLPVAL